MFVKGLLNVEEVIQKHIHAIFSQLSVDIKG